MTLNPPIRSWRGLRVWIIGASSGIGAALAHELSRQGAELILSARRLEAMQGLGLSKAKLIRLDVCDPQRLAEVCGELLASDGVDLVVWMAGIYRPLSSASYKLEDALDMT
ncbi:MAG: SDR family NAD(P)-dependent oxidoreductase, partial [Betaproteobacteria bacterium]|nr:SDR family NAD(P)-dependent oxidoreductase [Betaproteobacteria bacterium]